MSQLRSFLLIAGAYTFAYCMGLTFHEYGHAAIQWVGGLPDTRIHLHPFDISYVTHDDSVWFPPDTQWAPIHAIAGSCLNLLLALLILLRIWPFKRTYLLPILIIPGTSFLMEGVGMIVDLAMGGNDWDTFMSLTGTPLVLIIALILTVLGLGIFFMFLVMPFAGIRHDDAFLKRLLPFLGVAAFFGMSLLYVLMLGSKYRNTAHVLEARTIAFMGSMVLVFVITLLYRPLHWVVRRVSHSEASAVEWTHAVSALGAGSLVAGFMIATY